MNALAGALLFRIVKYFYSDPILNEILFCVRFDYRMWILLTIIVLLLILAEYADWLQANKNINCDIDLDRFA